MMSIRVVPMIDYIIDHRLVSANDQALDYDVGLSIINQNYVQIFLILYCIASTKFFKSKIISTKWHKVVDIERSRHLTNFDLYP